MVENSRPVTTTGSQTASLRIVGWMLPLRLRNVAVASLAM
jgi:hypothetical protein